MGPLSRKFNFHIKNQLKEAKIPTPSYDDEEDDEEESQEGAESYRDERSEEDEPSGSERDSPRAMVAQRKKSFFSLPKKKLARLDSPQPLTRAPSTKGKKRGPSLKLFKKPFKNSSHPTSASIRHAPDQWQERKQVSFQPDRAPSLNTGRAGLEQAGFARLATFERGTFDLGETLKGLGEQGINDLREQLSDANKECSEKIKRLLHQHYQAFISASKGIRAMDGEMQSLRAFLNKEHALLNSIKEIADPQGRFADKNLQATTSGKEWTRSWDDSHEGVKWHNCLQELDLAIAERKVAEALPLLKKTEKSLLPGAKSGLLAAYAVIPAQGESDQGDVKTSKQAQELALRRQRLAELVTLQISGSAVGSKEMQVATQVMASLSGRADALKKHLKAHTAALTKSIGKLLKPQNSGGDADGTEFSNALAQQVFGSIAAASEEVTIIFGKELKDLSSLFLVWALSETEKCALMLKRHALSPFAAPAGLGPTMACCMLAYIHCAALQSSHSLRLTSRLMRDLWPACDQVMQRRVKRIVEDVKAAVVAEVETIIAHGLPAEFGGEWLDLMQVFPSADLLLDELQAVINIMTPVGGAHIREALGQSVTLLFREYTNAMHLQFNHYRYDDGTLPKVLDDSIELALEVTHSLVEQFLPELAQPLRERCGDICNLTALNDQLNLFQDKLLPQEGRLTSIGTLEETDEEEEEEEEATPPASSMRNHVRPEWRQHKMQHPMYRVSIDMNNMSMDLGEHDSMLQQLTQGLKSDVSLESAATRSSNAEAAVEPPEVIPLPPMGRSASVQLQNRTSATNGHASDAYRGSKSAATSQHDREDGERSSPEFSSDADTISFPTGQNPPAVIPGARQDPRVAEKIAALSRKLGEGGPVPGPRSISGGGGRSGRYKPAGYGGLSDGATGTPSFARMGSGYSSAPPWGASETERSGRDESETEASSSRHTGSSDGAYSDLQHSGRPQAANSAQTEGHSIRGQGYAAQPSRGQHQQTEIVPESEEEETDSQASEEELEEMNEELSDYDDEKMLGALTKDS